MCGYDQQHTAGTTLGHCGVYQLASSRVLKYLHLRIPVDPQVVLFFFLSGRFYSLFWGISGASCVQYLITFLLKFIYQYEVNEAAVPGLGSTVLSVIGRS